MGVTRRLLNGLLRFSGDSVKGDYFAFLRQGWKSRSGLQVTRETAVQLALLEACLRVKAETMARLPLRLLKISEGEDGIKKVEEAKSRPLFRVLAHNANPYLTMPEFIGRLVIELELLGNFFALPEYDRAGRIIGLYPVPYSTVQPYWVDAPFSRAWRYTPVAYGEEQTQRPEQTLMQGEILHVRNHTLTNLDGLDGLRGTGLLHTQRETLGLSIEARNYASDLFANSAMPSALIKVRGSMTQKQKEQATKDWQSTYGSSSDPNANAAGGRGKVGFLSADSEFIPVSMKPLDTQFYQNRAAADSDVPRITGVPPFLVGLPSHTTYSNTEQQIRAFYTNTIAPLARRIEAALMRDLLSPEDRANYVIRFDMEELLQGDMATRTKFFGEMLRLGVFSPNEVREMENKNPREGGDEFAALPGEEGPGDEPGEQPPAQPANPTGGNENSAYPGTGMLH